MLPWNGPKNNTMERIFAMKTKVAQLILKKAGLYSFKIDGKFGRRSITAANSYYDFPDWSVHKLWVGVIQVFATRHNIKTGTIDGLWGQKTENAYEQILKILHDDLEDLGLHPPEKIEVNQHVVVQKHYHDWPSQNSSDLHRFYGDVGENQTSLKLPYPMVLAWNTDTVITKITCHEKCKDSFERIFTNVLDHYGMETIKKLHLNYYGGCLNVRKMRGGSKWSIHAYGAAIDIDPDRNQLRWGRDKAFLARPEYEPYWKFVEAEGGYSLGRHRNYDWMHFQFTK